MDKYQRLFIKQIKDKIKKMTLSGQWTPEPELYRLVHSAKGTSGTIGLDDWYQAASGLMDRLEPESEQVWSAEQVRELLAPMVYLFLLAEEEPEEGDTAVSEPEPQPVLAYQGTLLVVDDDMSLLQMLKDQLEQAGYMTLAASDGAKAMEIFYNMKPDCVILDVMLQDKDGFELLQEIQARSEQYLIPVILMSTSADRETRIRAYASGADDFIGKPLDMEEFIVRIRHQVQRRMKLNTLLMSDELTGAYNSSYFAQELVRHLQRLTDSHEPAVLTLFDLDSFRHINERFGYAEGDRLLRYFSDLVRSSLGPQDIWARDRYDRFYLLQPGIGEKEAVSFANQLLDRLEAEEHRVGPDSYRVTFSAGVLELKPGMTAQSCYDQILRIVAEAKRLHDGVMIVPERRRMTESRSTGAFGQIERELPSAPIGSRKEDIRAESRPALEARENTDAADQMEVLLSSVSSRLKKYASKEPLFPVDREEQTMASATGQSEPAVSPAHESSASAGRIAEEVLIPGIAADSVQMQVVELSPLSPLQADTIREREPAAGEGTRGTLEWVGHEERALVSQQAAEVDQAPVPPAGVKPWRLAIIDDDDLIRGMLSKRLGGLDIEHTLEVRTFSDGEDFFSDPWHGEDAQYVIILDRMMPRMNGMEVLRRIRGMEKRANYMVLMLTSVGDDREVAEAIRAGTDDYLTKPFSIVELEARIRRLLGRMGL
ncbi:GGDEF domain-containing response regulator [Paenibacillus wulumuqiensis]|uniref:GGDEF domain-containing response regulator n=1 Tax=Paenibacillus wulumuqiensis TaxID=1567107 RepID=UPI000A888AB5|nr:response regulator [Paenibacillus wulumuqiensis]